MASSSQPGAGSLDNEPNMFLRASETIRHVVLDIALDTVTDLGAFTVLSAAGGRKLSAEDITAELQITNPKAAKMVDAFLSLVACYGLVSCSLGPAGERVYSLNGVSGYFLSHQPGGVSLKPYLKMGLHKALWDCMREAKNAIVEGGVPFERANGMPLYAYVKEDENLNQAFNSAMASNSTMVINNLLQNYSGFKDLNTLVDVGGNVGTTLGMITSKYPSLKGINFDLPNIVQEAPPYIGVEHIGGDFFESVPKGDAILLKWILHNWSDDECIKLLKNCYDSIPSGGGKVIVVESILHAMPNACNPATKLAFLDNVFMTLLFGQGRERTREEYKALATEAGFSPHTMRFQDLTDCNFCVMEFFK